MHSPQFNDDVHRSKSKVNRARFKIKTEGSHGKLQRSTIKVQSSKVNAGSAKDEVRSSKSEVIRAKFYLETASPEEKLNGSTAEVQSSKGNVHSSTFKDVVHNPKPRVQTQS